MEGKRKRLMWGNASSVTLIILNHEDDSMTSVVCMPRRIDNGYIPDYQLWLGAQEMNQNGDKVRLYLYTSDIPL